jgi:3-oxoacyl-(acyl-carrier-protein) synthase
MLQRNEIPAMAHCDNCIEATPHVNLVTKNQKKPVTNILINAFNLSGSNASIVLKRFRNNGA